MEPSPTFCGGTEHGGLLVQVDASEPRTAAEAAAAPWDKRVMPIVATAALALYGYQVRHTKKQAGARPCI